MKALYWIVSSAVTIAGMGIMGTGASLMNRQNQKGVELHESYAQVRDMNIALRNAKLEILTDEKADSVKVDITNAYKNTTVKEDNGVLTISDPKRTSRFRFFSLGDYQSKNTCTAVITLPAGTELGEVTLDLGAGRESRIDGQRIETLGIDLGSGSLTVYGCEITKNIHSEIGSGSYKLEQTTVAGDSDFDIGSGHITLAELECSSFHYDSGSGSLDMANIQIKKDAILRIGSGNIQGETLNVSGRTDIDMASGNMQINGFTPGNSTNIELASGMIALGLTGTENDYSFDCSNASGSTAIGDRKGKDLSVKGGSKSIVSKGASGSITFRFEESQS